MRLSSIHSDRDAPAGAFRPPTDRQHRDLAASPGASNGSDTGGEVGVGLRKEHYQEIFAERPRIGWFEALSENYMVEGGRPLRMLERIRADHAVALHGVSLSVGSANPFDQDYLRRLKVLTDSVEPVRVSDHLCWTGHRGRQLHDLLPLPYTEEALAHVVSRVHEVQDFLGRTLLIENISSYLSCPEDELHEAEFLQALCDAAGCHILLDVNNVFVSAHNHGFDAGDYLQRLRPDSVREIHLAGHSSADGLLIDTHDAPVCDGVWHLYTLAIQRFGRVPTLIEWDAAIPPFAVLLREAERAQCIQNSSLREAASCPA